MRHSSDKKFSSGKKDRSSSGRHDKKNKPFRSGENRSEERRGPKKSGDERPRRPFNREGDKKEFKRADRSDRPKRTFDRDGDKKEFSRSDKPRFKRSSGHGGEKDFKRSDRNDRPKRAFDRDGDRKNFSSGKPSRFKRSSDGGEKKEFRRSDREERPKRSFDRDEDRKEVKRPFKKDRSEEHHDSSERTHKKPKPKKEGSLPSYKNEMHEKPAPRKRISDEEKHYRPFTKEFEDRKKQHHDYERPSSFKKHKSKHASPSEKEFDGLTRLNKYLSNAGVCSRREADDLIKAGAVKVNGVVVTEMGFKVKSTDVINYGGETLRNERKVYLLLNKPKDYITTTDDPHARHTVMELIEGACKERLYPVGRLDRNTIGLLLFTNDGEMAAKLMHPKFNVRKVYQVTLDKNLKPDDFEQLEQGLELEDGFIRPDEVSFVSESKREVGIEIHSGRNRIVRRMFEHLGYEVVKLDRVAYAGLTKKDLPRGKWRFLSPKEIGFLKMIG